MIAEYERQLESVNKAIAAIEGGAQEYRIGSQTVRYGDLATLYSERRRLDALISQSSGSCVTVARFPRGW